MGKAKVSGGGGGKIKNATIVERYAKTTPILGNFFVERADIDWNEFLTTQGVRQWVQKLSDTLFVFFYNKDSSTSRYAIPVERDTSTGTWKKGTPIYAMAGSTGNYGYSFRVSDTRFICIDANNDIHLFEYAEGALKRLSVMDRSADYKYGTGIALDPDKVVINECYYSSSYSNDFYINGYEIVNGTLNRVSVSGSPSKPTSDWKSYFAVLVPASLDGQKAILLSTGTIATGGGTLYGCVADIDFDSKTINFGSWVLLPNVTMRDSRTTTFEYIPLWDTVAWLTNDNRVALIKANPDNTLVVDFITAQNTVFGMTFVDDKIDFITYKIDGLSTGMDGVELFHLVKIGNAFSTEDVGLLSSRVPSGMTSGNAIGQCMFNSTVAGVNMFFYDISNAFIIEDSDERLAKLVKESETTVMGVTRNKCGTHTPGEVQIFESTN